MRCRFGSWRLGVGGWMFCPRKIFAKMTGFYRQCYNVPPLPGLLIHPTEAREFLLFRPPGAGKIVAQIWSKRRHRVGPGRMQAGDPSACWRARSRLFLDHFHCLVNRIDGVLHPFRHHRDRVQIPKGEFVETLRHSPGLLDVHSEFHGQLCVNCAINPLLNRLDRLRHVGPQLSGRGTGRSPWSRGSGFVRWQNVLGLDLRGLFGSGLRARRGGGPLLFAAAAENPRAQGNENECLFHKYVVQVTIKRPACFVAAHLSFGEVAE